MCVHAVHVVAGWSEAEWFFPCSDCENAEYGTGTGSELVGVRLNDSSTVPYVQNRNPCSDYEDSEQRGW